MRRLRVVLITALICIATSALFGAYHTSIPLDHRVYTVLENSEIRGLIKPQMAVRPYSARVVLALLDQIEGQGHLLSRGEREEVTSLKAQIEQVYGNTPSPIEDVFSTGFFRTWDEDLQMGASLGGYITTEQRFSPVTKRFDSRNTATAFLKGDLSANISYLMDFTLAFDHLDPALFSPSDFTIPGEGFYMRLIRTDSRYLRALPSDGFYISLMLAPELGASFLNDAVRLRWGAIKRDWGPGVNNLMISRSARAFDGIELQVDFASWLHYSVLVGSLGKFALRELDGRPFFSDDAWTDKPHYRFDNNISTHRVEVDFTKNLSFGIQEVVLWQKRFELSYLNPLTIYMFQQNNLGDIDEMLAGIDLTYTWPGKARFYGAVHTTEMNDVTSLKKLFTLPRNMLAFQAGVVVPLPIGDFSTLTAQWTYLGPFYYSHYPIREQSGYLDISAMNDPGLPDSLFFTSLKGKTYKLEKDGTLKGEWYKDKNNIEHYGWDVDTTTGSSWLSPDGRTEVELQDDKLYFYETTSETAYVNKGENLGYPLNPNSQEFLVEVNLGLSKGWTVLGELKYQARSGQYGYRVEQYMHYNASEGEYAPKAFWKNAFEHRLSLLLGGTKRIENSPIEVSASYRFSVLWERTILTEGQYDGKGTQFSPTWTAPVFDHVLQVGAKVYL